MIYQPFWVIQVQETNALVGTIMDVQPRMSGGGGGKSSDDIVFELAKSILGKLMDKLDIDLIRPDLLEVRASVLTRINMFVLIIHFMF